MNDMNNQSAASPQIPNPPGGGSWSWTGTEWVSLDPQPDTVMEAPAAPATPIPHNDNLPES
jgi:hypothetical protein